MDVIKPTKEKKKRKSVKKKSKVEGKKKENEKKNEGLEIPIFSTARRGSEKRESIHEELGKLWSDNSRGNPGGESDLTSGEDSRRSSIFGGSRRTSLAQNVFRRGSLMSDIEDNEKRLKLEKTISLLQQRRPSAAPKYFWDEVTKERSDENQPSRPPRRTTETGMSKEHAMTVLGLGRRKGSKTPRKLEEYTEEDLLEAFRAESSSLESKSLLEMELQLLSITTCSRQPFDNPRINKERSKEFQVCNPAGYARGLPVPSQGYQSQE
ncbi:uncharacterized protein LOC111709805 isoform X2 [Eurytemora carolleeae]|uniref:uncharacterized protein LOC111709805 isoform X2 n=1 Tax=Eurytemora carolleeae TaxID=1294199 RepID=UPI000C7928B5|nr:uncharacterized protein LOC111709805 isoform X2 [Eurytemora carolleeae]|eukprot:XP_023339485.1 uncharacterized protein LOC111709805 isoform X2 [Eurytemora affinis]